MPRKKYQTMALVFFVLLIGFVWMLTATSAHADFGITDIVNGMIRVVSYIMLSVAHIAIGFTLFFLRFFINLASYNGYIDAPIVVVGWTMVRDVANMFFVVIMLVIAFATILGLEQYEWRKLLVKLLLMAIFINFSNMLAQLVIDIAHVFTITFLNAISAAAGGNLINMFKLEKIVSIVGATPDFSSAEDFGVNILVASMAATVFAILAATTMGAYAIAMAIRVVVLWTLIILSPFAFVLAVLPATQDKAKQWWSEFSKHVIAAPVMVFFLWLAFATLGQGDAIQQIEQGASEQLSIASAEPPKLSLSEVTSWENMASFFVAMAFLWIGIQKVQELGITGGSIIGSSLNFAKKVATIATGYAAGRWLVGKGREVGEKAGRGALWYAPLVGGEKWAMRGKILGRAVQGWYRGKGYTTTKKGEELRGEAEDLMKQYALEKDPGKKEKIMEQVKEKEDLMSKEFRGGLIGWASRSGIQLEKQLSKTEKQAANRREVLWKRVGSEAGGSVLGGMIQVGMGTKGLGIGKYRILGDQYAGQDAQDRIERGWLKGEEMRSRAKDHEFEARGKEEVLEKARMKYDVKKGRMTYEVSAGTMMERVEGHETRGETYDQSDHRLQAEARLKLILENGPTWQNFLKAQNVANLTKMTQASVEQGLFKDEDIKQRSDAIEANKKAINLEQEARETHSPEAIIELAIAKKLRDVVNDEVAPENWKEEARKGIEEAKQRADDADDKDATVQEKRETLKKQANDLLSQQIAWRYGVAKAGEETAGRMFSTFNAQLVADADQRTEYDKRGIVIPKGAFAELGEAYSRIFHDIPFDSFVSNMTPMIEKLSAKHEDKSISKEERRLDRANTMGTYLHGFKNSWIDDFVYGLRNNPKMKKLVQEKLGWDPEDNIMTPEKLANIHAMLASGFDMDFAAQDSVVRQLLSTEAVKKHNLSVADVYDGMKTGDFGTATEDIKKEMKAYGDKTGGKQQELVGGMFEGAPEKREELYSEFMKNLDEYQPELEVMGNMRDAAIMSTHGENAGFYQTADIQGKRVYIPHSVEGVREYVLGDVRKLDSNIRYKHHGHAWGNIDQEGDGSYGQSVYEIREDEYADYRGDVADQRLWDRTTQPRTKNFLVGLDAKEEGADFIGKDEQGKATFKLGRDNVQGKLSGFFKMYRYNHKEEFEQLKDNPEEQEKLAIQYLIQKRFARQLRRSPRDLLYGLAQKTGIPLTEAEYNGTINLTLGKDHFTNINQLIDAVNEGKFGKVDGPLIRRLEFEERGGGKGKKAREDEDEGI